MQVFAIRALPFIVTIAATTGCAADFPVNTGKVLTITRADDPLPETDPNFRTALQIRWLGTACHLLQLGDASILTDPFVSYHSMTRVGLGKIASDENKVRDKFAGLPPPQAIFIGHSHYDHTLDLPAAMQLPGWQSVPVYGSVTTKNILHGFGPELADRLQQTETDETWRQVAVAGNCTIEYMSVLSEHAPQLGRTLLYPGKVTEPMKKPPTRAPQFKVGETYAYFFRLTHGSATPTASRPNRTSFTVYFADAAANAPIGLPKTDPPAPIDIAILCVPGWRNVKGYPDEVIRRLKPRHIVLSHFDNFFQEDFAKPEVVPTADLQDFLQTVQNAADYPEFENICVPAVDTFLHFEKS